MKTPFLFLLIMFSLAFRAGGQNTLYDDTRLCSIHITLPPDSLQRIYDSVLSDHYYMARFVFDDQGQRDTLENVGFRLRGNTSRYSQKKSFKISFNEYVSGRTYQDVKKLNLNGEHNDPTMIREKLFYDLWKKAGFPERRTAFVKVYINGRYYGLYTNLEEMDKSWLTRVFPDNNGNLYKCTYPADLAYLGPNVQTYKDLENSTATGGRVYELETNKTKDDYTRLVELIAGLDKPAGGQFPEDIEQILDAGGFLKALALDVATGNWDDYGYNKNNYYLYDCPADSRFHFITYDPDNTFGVDWFGIDWSKHDCRHWINPALNLPLAEKLLAVPEYYDRYRMFLDTLAREVIPPDSVFPRIDFLKQLIYEAAVADTFRTLDYGYTMADFNDGFVKAVDQHTPIGLKPFFTQRQDYIIAQLNAWGIGEPGPAGYTLSIFPNPATDRISFPVPGKVLVTARITDAFGNTVLAVPLNPGSGGNRSIPVASLAPGLYILSLETPGRVVRAKFIRN